jgi:acetate kinase
MPDRASADIVALNSGSSSLKFSLYKQGTEDEELLLQGSAQGIGRESGTPFATCLLGPSAMNE